MLLIPLGVGILALEFAWARRLQKRTGRIVDERVCKSHADSRIGRIVCRRHEDMSSFSVVLSGFQRTVQVMDVKSRMVK
jgi:hypothetical protein